VSYCGHDNGPRVPEVVVNFPVLLRSFCRLFILWKKPDEVALSAPLVLLRCLAFSEFFVGVFSPPCILRVYGRGAARSFFFCIS